MMMEIFTLIFLQLSSSLSEALKDMTNHVIIGTLIQLVKNSSMPYPAEELPCHEATVCQNQTSDKDTPAIYLN
jgi:hypothetical protein